MQHKKRNIRIILFLILPILGFLLGWGTNQKRVDQLNIHKEVVTHKPAKKSGSILDSYQKKIREPKEVDLDLFWEVWNTLDNNFLYTDRLTTEEQLFGAADGLVKSLKDPYTIFMSPEKTKDFEDSLTGQFEGIGAEVAIKKNVLTIVSPLHGSPAELAGLRAGDQVLKVNGESTLDMSIIEAITKIRGPRGEKVVLTIYRKDEREDPFEITIVRDKIITNDLSWEMKDDIAVIKINIFGVGVAKEFQNALEKIVLEEPRAVIIDLRNNGGGVFDECISIADEIFDRKPIVQIKRRDREEAEVYTSKIGGGFANMPLVVLVNKGSASASEIIAGAVKDHNRGLLIGEKTFGKGSVQNTIPLSRGSTLKVTIAEWLTPNGVSISKKGITPHEEIIRTKEDFDNDYDPVMERALEVAGTDMAIDIMQEAVIAEQKAATEEASEE